MTTPFATTSERPHPHERTVRVRCHELSPRIGDLSANLAAITDSIRSAASDDVELLVLPELATSGYYLRDAVEASHCAIASTDPIFREWTGLLPSTLTVVVGFCENLNGVLHNSAAVITSEGLAAVYRKAHLWDREQLIFVAGNEPPPVVETSSGRLGVLICYDLEFPEMPRSVALRGADVIAVPTNWPIVPRPEGEHPPEVLQAMAAARSSCVAIVCCDRSGEERGHAWTEGTSIIGSDGWLAGNKDALGRVESVLEIEVDRTQIGPLNNVISDRRPEIYSESLHSEQ